MRANVPVWLVGVCILAFCSPGCDRSAVGNVATALAKAEVFDFDYMVLQPGSDGKFTLRMDLGSGCEDFSFTEDELAQTLSTKQFPITHSIGGRTIPVNATFAFHALDDCVTSSEVKFETDDLSVAITDAAGNVTGRDRPESAIGIHLVDTDLSAGGVLEVNVFGIKVIGTTDSRTLDPGPVTLSTGEVPAGKIGRSGAPFEHVVLIPPYGEASLDEVLSNPSRFTASFAFLAKTNTGGPELLLVWDGDMVLRTDI